MFFYETNGFRLPITIPARLQNAYHGTINERTQSRSQPEGSPRRLRATLGKQTMPMLLLLDVIFDLETSRKQNEDRGECLNGGSHWSYVSQKFL
jgi:hypothetical protein